MIVESEIRERAYRFVAFSAVGFSLAAIVAVVVMLPLVKTYVNGVHSRVYNEMEFCKVTSGGRCGSGLTGAAAAIAVERQRGDARDERAASGAARRRALRPPAAPKSHSAAAKCGRRAV